MADETNEITMTEEELGSFACGIVAVGVVVGAVGTVAAIGYTVYKAYQALADSDIKIILTIEEGAVGREGVTTRRRV